MASAAQMFVLFPVLCLTLLKRRSEGGLAHIRMTQAQA